MISFIHKILNRNTSGKETNENARKRKFSKFFKFLIIYSAVLILVIIIIQFYLYGLLKDYERSMPNDYVGKLLPQFYEENIEKTVTDHIKKIPEFNSTEDVVLYFKEKVQGKNITFKRKSGEYTNDTPVYLVVAGDTTIAKVTLKENGKNAHKFKEWKSGEIDMESYITDPKDITITAPSNAKILINNKILETSYITEKDILFEPVLHVSTFVSTPVKVKYMIKGLVKIPDITAQLGDTPLQINVKDKEFNVDYPKDDRLLETQSNLIHSINQAYGLYMINKGSLGNITKHMVGNAKKYVSDIPAVWAFLYGKSYTYEFKNEKITDVIKYSENCFSCRSYYDLYVKWDGGDKTYNTDMTYTFVNKDGVWLLADFIIN